MKRHPKNKTFIRVLWVSLGLHILLLVSAIVFPELWPAPPDTPSMPGPISVEMVSLSGSSPPAPLTAEEKAQLDDAAPTPAPPTPPPKEEVIPLPPEKTPLVSKPVAKTPTPAPQPKKSRVLSALDAIDDVSSKKSSKTSGQGEGTGSGTYAGKGSGPGSGDGRPLTLEDLYRLEIAKRVEQKWVVSDQLIGRRKLVLEMRFKVLPDGELGEMWVDRKSGNVAFDASTEKAVLKAAPFPAHPDGVNKSYILVLLRFTPEGISDIKR